MLCHVIFQEKISNESEFRLSYSLCGKVECPLIKAISEKIPRPYAVNDLEIIFNGIRFDANTDQICKITSSSNGFDSPVGNYISYERSNYGSEKHSYIQFSADDDNVESMRSIFFKFAKNIGGKYEGT